MVLRRQNNRVSNKMPRRRKNDQEDLGAGGLEGLVRAEVEIA
jgi:hypothetical protein